MAKSTATSRIFGKAKKAATRQWKNSRGKEATVAGGSQLPGGIVGGVAKLANKDWRETEDKKVPYLLLQFVVVEPEEHEGVKQSLSYFFQDTKYKKIQDTTDRLSSDVQLMGVDTDGMTLDELDAAIDELIADETFIEFKTREGETDDKKRWFKFDICGVADGEYDTPEDDEPEPDDEDLDDDYDEDEPDGDEDDEPEPPPKRGRRSSGGKGGKGGRRTRKPEPEPDEDDEDDEPDEDEDEPDEDDENEPDEDDEDGDGDWQPEKKEVYGYKPPKSRKSYDMEVLTVNTTKETCTLKRLSDGKKFNNVPWDKMEGGE